MDSEDKSKRSMRGKRTRLPDRPVPNGYRSRFWVPPAPDPNDEATPAPSINDKGTRTPEANDEATSATKDASDSGKTTPTVKNAPKRPAHRRREPPPPPSADVRFCGKERKYKHKSVFIRSFTWNGNILDTWAWCYTCYRRHRLPPMTDAKFVASFQTYDPMLRRRYAEAASIQFEAKGQRADEEAKIAKTKMHGKGK